MKKNYLSSKSGFTVTEMLVTVGLTAVFMLMASSTLRDIYKISQDNTKQVDAETDISIAMRYLSELLKDAGPSFNNVKGNLDDNGHEFFDHIFDVSTKAWSEEQSTRNFTLDIASGRHEFFFLTHSKNQVDQVYYTPLTAYVDVEPNADMNTSSTITYGAFNKDNAISSRFPKIWQQNANLMLRIPIPLRYVAVDGTVNMNAPPRQHIFFGIVASNDLKPDNFAGHIYTTHPIDESEVINADTFLRKIPTVGGASPLVELVAVQGWKIALVKRAGTPYYDLFSYEYHAGSFTKPHLILPKVKFVKFTRDSVSLNLINIEMLLDKSPPK